METNTIELASLLPTWAITLLIITLVVMLIVFFSVVKWAVTKVADILKNLTKGVKEGFDELKDKISELSNDITSLKSTATNTEKTLDRHEKSIVDFQKFKEHTLADLAQLKNK